MANMTAAVAVRLRAVGALVLLTAALVGVASVAVSVPAGLTYAAGVAAMAVVVALAADLAFHYRRD